MPSAMPALSTLRQNHGLLNRKPILGSSITYSTKPPAGTYTCCNPTRHDQVRYHTPATSTISNAPCFTAIIQNACNMESVEGAVAVTTLSPWHERPNQPVGVCTMSQGVLAPGGLPASDRPLHGSPSPCTMHGEGVRG